MEKKRLQLRIVTAVLGVGFVAAGLAMGQYWDTLQKAVLVCLECVGSG